MFVLGKSIYQIRYFRFQFLALVTPLITFLLKLLIHPCWHRTLIFVIFG